MALQTQAWVQSQPCHSLGRDRLQARCRLSLSCLCRAELLRGQKKITHQLWPRYLVSVQLEGAIFKSRTCPQP